MTTTAAAPPKQPAAEYIQRSVWKQAVLGSLNVLALVLAVRFALLVAIVGAVILAWVAIQFPDPWRLGALGIYALAVVIPTVWLASRR